MKTKLLNIVIGDGRAEVLWNANGAGTGLKYSNFAEGADDKKQTENCIFNGDSEVIVEECDLGRYTKFRLRNSRNIEKIT